MRVVRGPLASLDIGEAVVGALCPVRCDRALEGHADVVARGRTNFNTVGKEPRSRYSEQNYVEQTRRPECNTGEGRGREWNGCAGERHPSCDCHGEHGDRIHRGVTVEMQLLSVVSVKSIRRTITFALQSQWFCFYSYFRRRESLIPRA